MKFDYLKPWKAKYFAHFIIMELPIMYIMAQKSDDFTDLKDLTSEERVSHIVEKANYYGFSGDTLRGLIFVSRKEEAIEIAEMLTARNIPSKSLIGSDTE